MLIYSETIFLKNTKFLGFDVLLKSLKQKISYAYL